MSDRICLMNNGKIEQVGTAMEIYDRPETRFVAEFVGVTNSIEGTAAGTGVFTTGEDVKFKIGDNGAGKVSGKHFVSIRPHRIEIHKEGAAIDGAEGMNVFDGEVLRGHFLGSSADYLVKVSGLNEPLRVEADPAIFYPTGTKVRLVIDPESVIPVRSIDD